MNLVTRHIYAFILHRLQVYGNLLFISKRNKSLLADRRRCSMKFTLTVGKLTIFSRTVNVQRIANP
jgi:hypothetical protein